MKQLTLARLSAYLTPTLLALLLLSATACNPDTPSHETDTLPSTIETVAPDTDPVDPSESDTVSAETEPQSPIDVVTFPASTLPDYTQYTSSGRIQEVLSQQTTYAFTLNGSKYYQNGQLTDGGADVLARQDDRTLTVNGDALALLIGQAVPSGAPAQVADALGMGVAVYDGKLVLFYEKNQPLHVYDDLYTFEAMHLYMTNASETEIINAFIDLPSRISNGTSNTIFYTESNLNLGVQTSVYYAQIGDTEGVLTGPSLVVGEGKHKDNHTTVRIFNEQQTCISQFLAFNAKVQGGVQVTAAAVGNETLIATAPYAAHDGKNGDIRVFDAFGLLRMELYVRDLIPGPHIILTGHFSDKTENEVLLVASSTTDANGNLRYALLSLQDGSVLVEHTLDCAFALSGAPGAVPVEITSRFTENGTDTAILYFPTVQGVYEGSPMTAEFASAGITMPADATGVSASNRPGERYIVFLPAREGEENLSYITVFDTASTEGREFDIGFRENRFYSARYVDGYNDDQYVSAASYLHIRTDMTNAVCNGITQHTDDTALSDFFERQPYSAYAFPNASDFAARLSTEYLYFEPCFTHRWVKTPYAQRMASYRDATTGSLGYVALGRDGQYSDYSEVGDTFFNLTYSDGILELAKLRIFPLRSFLRATAPAFRGEGGNPEHMVGMEPVHEQEINVPGSVGDYNLSMIEGFRRHLLNLYGNVSNINAAFGTSFTSENEIDPPRDQSRGDWDAYSGAYFTEWQLYNRTVISKRIIEAYREALLAGYPPETITAHQIPEAETIGGVLGVPAERLTPIDIAVSCGTAYGGTRYGNFVANTANFVYLANRMGHNSITLGEYCCTTENPGAAYSQLKNLWSKGTRMVHQITLGNPAYEAAEAEAMSLLVKENLPRPGYTGGTTNSLGVKQGSQAYQIVQIGAGDDSRSNGLLKSIDEEGKWEGTVYLVPFRSKIMVESLDGLTAPVEGAPNRFSSGKIGALKNMDMAELTFEAAYIGEGEATVTIEVYHAGHLLTDSVTTYTLTDTLTPYRFCLSNQLYESDLEIIVTFHSPQATDSMEGITLRHMQATLQTERTGTAYYNGTGALRASASHAGGVSFDLLDRDRRN